MSRHREYELRLAIDAKETEALVSHPLMRRGLRDRQVEHLVSTYYDTPDLTLQRHNFGLRIRRADTRVTQTLKRTGTSFLDRGEWERDGGGTGPNVVWLRQTPLAPLLRDEQVSQALQPRFTVDVTRSTFQLRHRGTRIEAALDSGEIAANGVSLPLSELELELKEGRPTAVLDLARRLVRDLPLTLSLATKSERGYGVGDKTWGYPTQTIVPTLKKRMTIAQAFEATVQTCLHVFLKNVTLIRGDSEGEALHKARINLRHLRAAFQAFGPALRRKRFARIRREVKWLSGRLGHARDADVFEASLFDSAARRTSVMGLDALANVMGKHRRRAHDSLAEALASSRARLLFVDLLALSTDGIRRRMRTRRFRPFVTKALLRQHEALAVEAKGLKKKSVIELHDLRKSAKMLRYDLDLFSEVLKKGARRELARLVPHLKTLQQSLGILHDGVAMREHLRDTVLARRRGGTGESRRAMFAAAHLSAAAAPDRNAYLRVARKAAAKL